MKVYSTVLIRQAESRHEHVVKDSDNSLRVKHHDPRHSFKDAKVHFILILPCLDLVDRNDFSEGCLNEKGRLIFLETILLYHFQVSEVLDKQLDGVGPELDHLQKLLLLLSACFEHLSRQLDYSLLRQLDAVLDLIGRSHETLGVSGLLALLYKLGEVLHVDQAADFVVETDVEDFEADNPLKILLLPTSLVKTVHDVLLGHLLLSIVVVVVVMLLT